MKLGYSDFVLLCRVDNPADWVDWLELRQDGVYVKEPCSGITFAERAVLSRHPTGDLSKPVLEFPCLLTEFQRFLEDQDIYGAVDAFDMADWVRSKLEADYQLEQRTRSASGTSERRASAATRVERTLLSIIAALLDQAHIDPSDRSASSRIAEATEFLGCKVDADTVRKYLRRLPDTGASGAN